MVSPQWECSEWIVYCRTRCSNVVRRSRWPCSGRSQPSRVTDWVLAQRPFSKIGVEIDTCAACDGAVRIIACIEDPEVIEKIRSHLDAKGAAAEASRRPPCRAPPQTRLFD